MSSPSNPFKHLTSDWLDKIESAHKAGKTPEQIGITLGLDYDDVRLYIDKFLVQPRTHFERLQKIVDDLEDQCTQTKLEIDSGSNSAMMLQSYQKLMSEYRLALAEMMAIHKPQDAVDDLVKKIFQPFVISLVRTCTEESSKLRTELLKLSVNERDAMGISVDIFTRLTERIQSLLPTVREDMDKHFGVKKIDQNARNQSAIEEALVEREKSTIQ